MATDKDWPPLSTSVLEGAGPPTVSKGFLRLNKRAVQNVVREFALRDDGARDLAALLGLLCHAGWRTKAQNPLEGCVVGTDSALAELVGLDRKTFGRAAENLVARRFLERLDPGQRRGYRVRRPVWEWLLSPSAPEPPAGLLTTDPFADVPGTLVRRGTRPRRGGPSPLVRDEDPRPAPEAPASG